MTAIITLGIVSITISCATLYLVLQNKRIRNEIKPFFFINGWLVRKRIEKKTTTTIPLNPVMLFVMVLLTILHFQENI